MAYTLSTAFAIYFVIWWIVLFVTLPFECAANTRTARRWRVPTPARQLPL